MIAFQSINLEFVKFTTISHSRKLRDVDLLLSFPLLLSFLNDFGRNLQVVRQVHYIFLAGYCVCVSVCVRLYMLYALCVCCVCVCVYCVFYLYYAQLISLVKRPNIKLYKINNRNHNHYIDDDSHLACTNINVIFLVVLSEKLKQ